MGLRARGLTVGGHSVLLVDRHVLLSPSVLSCAYRSSVGCVSRGCDGAATLRAMRFGVESGRFRHRLRSRPSGHSSCTKSVIRDSTIFAPQMVTSEFYARVTKSLDNTGLRRPAEPIRDKRPACRWLRSSRRNSADQGSIVIESLCKNFAPSHLGHRCASSGQFGRDLSRLTTSATDNSLLAEYLLVGKV